MSEHVEFAKYEPKGKRRSEVPLTLDWNNAKMVRIHSIIATVREILASSEGLKNDEVDTQGLDVIKINIVGTPSTGKSTLAFTLAHLCHKLAKIPYTVRYFNRQDLIHFEQTLASLQPTNHIMIFDDISFLDASAGSRDIKKIQQTFTEIRHLPGGQDVKIIAIFNFHYNMSVPKYLRQSEFFYYTTIGSSEVENTMAILGKKYLQKILDFKRIVKQGTSTGLIPFSLGKKGQKFTYKWRSPFAPSLFWNEDTARVVVFPRRDWIDKVCSMCTNSSSKVIKEDMDMIALDVEMKKKFGVGVIKQAMRIELFNMGVYTYSKRVKQALLFINNYMTIKNCDAEQMAEFYDLKDERTRLDKF